MPRALAQRPRAQHLHECCTKALTSSLDLDSILQTIMEKMAEYFQPDTWSLLMVDEEHNELYFAIAVGRQGGGTKKRSTEGWRRAISRMGCSTWSNSRSFRT